jgi:hypothetical protein
MSLLGGARLVSAISMEALAALGCVEPATAGSAVMEETRVLTILLAVLRVELLLLLSTLGGEVSVRQRTRLLPFATVFALAFAILAFALALRLRLPFLLLPVIMPPLLLAGAALAAPAPRALLLAPRRLRPSAETFRQTFVCLLAILLHFLESLLLLNLAAARRLCAVAQ